MSSVSAPVTVLVLGAGGNVSQGILKALARASLPFRVVAACLTPFAVGLYRAERAYLSPRADDPGFIDWVIGVCEREGVTAVLSGVEPELSALAEAADAIRRQTGAVCIVSSPRVLEIGQDKLATCRWLAQQGLPHPGFASAEDAGELRALVARHGFPLIAKPRRGRSARGVVRVDDERQLELFAGRDDVIVQEMLGVSENVDSEPPGEPTGPAGDRPAPAEYTSGCFVDAGGRLRGCVVMRRELLDGTTVRAEVGDFEQVREISQQVVAALGPLGPCNVQLRLARDGVPTPFDINVRFSGTTPVRARLGFNEVEAAVRHLALGEAPHDLAPARHGTVVRYWNEMYIPPDAID
ncbi:MAG TPA: ATP-grasp domain-containing protein, partial [Solirubrobacteraceae bacterium]|nr:ATP-grasp domain-containing protein [Solirubrobacteraceae bacterium]